MPGKNHFAVTGVLFSLVALTHLVRIVSGAPVLVGWAVAIVRQSDDRTSS